MIPKNSLAAVPRELFDSILSYLPNSDIKSLRLTCKHFSDPGCLRIQRVFLSANPLNIEIFYTIANHETFRHNIVEIIWDDARFITGPPRYASPSEEDRLPLVENEEDYYEDENKECPQWFANACADNLEELTERKGCEVDRPDHIARAEQVAAQPPLRECWGCYQALLRQQEDVLAAGSDEDALLYGLKQFPALKRVAITPATHGHLFTPLYQTPMIRAFPKGFNYPIPRGWPISREGKDPPTAHPWQELDEAHKDKYRGFRIVTRVLAKKEHNVTELILNANQLPTGMNCTILDEPCEEYDNLATVLKRPGFCRLDLALLVGGLDDDEVDWRSFRNGRLRQALSEAKDIEDFRFHTTVLRDPGFESTTPVGAGPLRHFIPLRSIFPVEQWTKLRHFELSRFLVVENDVIRLLSALPETLRTVQLSWLKFLDNNGTWYSFLEKMRIHIRKNTLWPNRDTASRLPKVTIGVSAFHGRAGRGIWLEKEVQDFLYGEGEHPFLSYAPRSVRVGMGTERDTFEPNHERPHASRSVLEEQRYFKPLRWIDLLSVTPYEESEFPE